VDKELLIQKAIVAYRTGVYSSVRAVAVAFAVPVQTLRDRAKGIQSRSMANEHNQSLSPAEERTLVKWISHLTRAGYPIAPSLAYDIAENIRSQRYQLSTRRKSDPPLRPLGVNWLNKFKSRYPEIQSVWARKIENARHKAVTKEAVTSWFEAVTSLIVKHQYPPHRIYNMDESGFAIGDSQSSRALVNIREETSWKVIAGRQEWVTAIECVNALGTALPPLVIFKALHTNTAWIPAHTPLNWQFSTSNSGWTSDSHGFEWLQRLFDPLTRPDDPSERRLLILDGHSSHITANFIAYCMNNQIDLLVLPPHTSHVLQPLDISIFQPLKRALATETDRLAALDSGRIPRIEWTEAYIRAREKAFSSKNIQIGWKATGLWPLSALEVLNRLPQMPQARSSTPPQQPSSHDLDKSLLDSSPPEGTELRQANALLSKELDKGGALATPAKRYTKRMTLALETSQSENVLLRKQLADTQALLRKRKERKKGKRVALKGRFVFSTQEVLDIAKAAEAETVNKKGKNKASKKAKPPPNEDSDDEVIEIGDEDSDSDCIMVAPVRSNRR
jgi:hypothetical protein